MASDALRSACLVTVITVAAVACAARPARAASGEDPARRVRGVDTAAQALIARAVDSSPTVASLVSALGASDVVVMVQVSLTMRSDGDTRLFAASPTCRYVFVRVAGLRSPREQMTSLGHELQHAKEVADAQDVRDKAALARLMERIGRRTGTGTFETDAAIRVGQVVKAEIADK